MITMLSKTFQNVYYNLWYTVYYNVQISLRQLTKLHRLLKNEKPGKISAQKEKLESSELKFCSILKCKICGTYFSINCWLINIFASILFLKLYCPLYFNHCKDRNKINRWLTKSICSRFFSDLIKQSIGTAEPSCIH